MHESTYFKNIPTDVGLTKHTKPMWADALMKSYVPPKNLIRFPIKYCIELEGKPNEQARTERPAGS